MKIVKFIVLIVFLMAINASLSAQSFYHAINYGGKEQFKDLVKTEMVYPENALQNNIEGTVKISLLVDKTGNASNFELTKTVSPEIDVEALRLLGLLLWEPAQYNGSPIDEKMDIEFEFSIKKYKRMVQHRGYDKVTYPFEPIDSSTELHETKKLDIQPKPVYQTKGMNFSSFIMKNMTYPKDAVKLNISGTVTVFFVIETTGRISNIKVLNGVGAGCNQEAIRLLKLINWMPGIKNGMAVRTKMALGITFNLQDFENQKYVPANNSNQI